MASGTPYKVCGGNAATGSATLVVTVTNTTQRRDTIAVWVTSNNNNLQGVSDSQNNVYTPVGQPALNGTIAGQWFVATAATRLTAGGVTPDTITLTCSGTGGAKTLTAVGCPGMMPVGVVDQTPVPTTGTSTAPSITTGTLAQADEAILAGLANANTGGAVAWSGVTGLDSQHNGSAQFGAVAYSVVSATTPVTASGTIVSAAWGMAALSLRGASYPSSILDLQAELKLGSTWTDISGDVYSERQKPQIVRGRPDESGQATPSAFTAQLDNRAGAYSPRNPTGVNYGLIGKNTPIRVHVPEGGVYLRLEDDAVSYASTPSSASINVAGDLEARIDLNLTGWMPGFVCGKWNVNNSSTCWALLLNGDGTLTFAYTTDGSTVRKATSTRALPWPGGRISLKVTYTSASGLVNFYYATTIGGSYTQIGTTVTGPVSGAIFAGAAQVQVGWNNDWANNQIGTVGNYGATGGTAWAPAAQPNIQGKVYEFQIRNGIGGSLVADPIFSGQTANATSFVDAQSNTWTLNGTAALSSRKFRFHGEIPAWPPRWDQSGQDVYVPLVANGLLRRLQQSGTGSTVALESAMTRAWKLAPAAFPAVAYWPVEDASGATVIASGLAGGRPMILQGKGGSTLGGASPVPCTNALGTPGTNVWTGRVPPYTGGAANVLRFILSIPSGGDTNNLTMARMYTSGSVNQVDVVYTTASSGSLSVQGLDGSGASLFSSSTITGLNGTTVLVEAALTSSSPVSWQIKVLPLQTVTATIVASTVTGTLGNTTRIVINPNGANFQSGVGQIGVQAQYANLDAPSAWSLEGPFNAWQGETAGNRFARLCGEEGIACRIAGYPFTSAQMGYQTSQTLMALLQECEDADAGMIYEPRQCLALGYRTSASMTNQAQAVSGVLPLALSYTAAQLGGGGGMGIEPTDDDAFLVNDVIATRTGGSSAEVSETGAVYAAITSLSAATAALNTSAPPAGAGGYQGAKTVNVLSDGQQLPDSAGWAVHLGTVNEPRYPSIPVDLARPAVASVVNQVADLDLGDYLQITPTASPLPPDAVKALVWGETETLGGKIWTIERSTRPESPFETLIAGTGATSDNRADTAGSSLSSSATSGATSLSVATSTGPLWTTVAGDFPFDVIVGGERMTVTNITGASSPQTFTVTRAVNGVTKAHGSGESVSLFQPVYAALV